MPGKPLDINALAEAARAQAARRRAARASDEPRVIGNTSSSPAPAAPSVARRYAARQGPIDLAFDDRPRDDAPAASVAGEPLECVRTEHRIRYALGGRNLEVGDPIEVYTNSTSGWIQGRFEWSGSGRDLPCLGLNLWGDAEGEVTWAGDLIAPLPPGALCRRPA